MVEEAVVLQASALHYTVQVARSGNCTGCKSKKACLSSHEQAKDPVFTVPREADAPYAAGDRVRIAIQTGGVLKASFLVYLLPILLLMICAIGARLFNKDISDAFVAGCAFGGLVLGFIIALFAGRAMEKNGTLQVRIIGPV